MATPKKLRAGDPKSATPDEARRLSVALAAAAETARKETL